MEFVQGKIWKLRAALFLGGGALSLVPGCLNPFAPGIDNSPANPSCDPTTVEGIFQCFQTAYTFRDTLAYGQLLAGNFVFVYRDYEVGIDVTWGRDEEMRVTHGLFQNSQNLDLIWNNFVTRTETDTTATAVRGFNLTVTYNPSSIDRVDGYANLTMAREHKDEQWRITLWRDESNF
jgi:hypothetical protein